MLVGWEIMGWCSWLLIGHDSERPEARRAAYKAFIVTRVADIGMVVGLVALAVRAGSTDLIAVLTADGHETALTVGLVGVIIGVAGKSGLIPFHDWLPDAMEGPTPASALIHAATMVAAGSYVIARLFALYAGHDGARTLLAVLAAATMVYAALLALVQTDLKRMLAYSTLSQIAIMLAALAAAPRDIGSAPAMSHLVGHAFFKSLLFLAAGWLSVLAGATALAALRGRLHGTGALRWSMGLGPRGPRGRAPAHRLLHQGHRHRRRARGRDRWRGSARLARRRRPLRHGRADRRLLRPDLAAARHPLARPDTGTDTTTRHRDAGPRPADATDVPETVVVAEEDVAVVTVADSADDAEVERVRAHGHAPITLAAALSVAVLAALTVVGTLLLTSLNGALHIGVLTALLSVLLIAGGAYAVWTLSDRGRHDVADRVPGHVREAAVRGFGADTAYLGVGRAVTAVARLVVVLDRDVVDAYPRATAVVARGLGRAGERSHRGVPSLSLVGLLVGVVVIAVLGVTAWR